jgi:hypothetical protein
MAMGWAKPLTEISTTDNYWGGVVGVKAAGA